MQTYYAVNGGSVDINVTGNLFGLWEKAGIPRPLSEADAKLVARLLKNYANLQRYTLGEDHNYFWRTMGYEQDDIETIEWTDKIANFFEHSGGLLEGYRWR